MKVINIFKCSDCPYGHMYIHGAACNLRKDSRISKKVWGKSIPDWCPLPDREDDTQQK